MYMQTYVETFQIMHTSHACTHTHTQRHICKDHIQMETDSYILVSVCVQGTPGIGGVISQTPQQLYVPPTQGMGGMMPQTPQPQYMPIQVMSQNPHQQDMQQQYMQQKENMDGSPIEVIYIYTYIYV